MDGGWNIYLATLIDHSPAWAPQLIAYQRIITSASAQYPLAARLNYDTQLSSIRLHPTLGYPSHRSVAAMHYKPLPCYFLAMLTLWDYKLLPR